MPHHGSIPPDRPDNHEGTFLPSRRTVLAGGGLMLGSLFLPGCNPSARVSSRLPDTPWTASAPPTVAENRTVTIASAPTAQPAPPPSAPSFPGGIIPRSQWARAGIRGNDAFPMNGIRKITVHHDGMPPVSLSSQRQVASRIEQIRQAHVVGRGWADLGYHYVIDPSGRIWEGRDIYYQGAHVQDQNENNLGILVMGNFDKQTPSPAALATLDAFLVNQMQQYRISLSGVRTHKERAKTACPGRNLQQYMQQTRSRNGNLFAMANHAGLSRG